MLCLLVRTPARRVSVYCCAGRHKHFTTWRKFSRPPVSLLSAATQPSSKSQDTYTTENSPANPLNNTLGHRSHKRYKSTRDVSSSWSIYRDDHALCCQSSPIVRSLTAGSFDLRPKFTTVVRDKRVDASLHGKESKETRKKEKEEKQTPESSRDPGDRESARERSLPVHDVPPDGRRWFLSRMNSRDREPIEDLAERQLSPFVAAIFIQSPADWLTNHASYGLPYQPARRLDGRGDAQPSCGTG